jgi:ABC-type transport system involved in cytochrome c biogenesis permease subunit
VTITSWLPFAFYAAAAAAYVTHFSRRNARTGRTATALLGVAVLAHTFLIGMQTMEAGYAPLVGTTAAVSAFVWLLGLAYLYVELTTEERAMGAFVTILLAVLAILPALNPQLEERPELLRSPLFTVHVLSMLVAYASFALAFVLGITYVLLFKEIKAKHLGFFYARLPSLQVLDAMNGRAIVVGWLFLTCGLVVGGIWTILIHGAADPRAQAMRMGDPKILFAVVSWGMYSFALLARRSRNWTGRRAAWLSTVGFVVVLLNFVPVGYFLTRSHNF